MLQIHGSAPRILGAMGLFGDITGVKKTGEKKAMLETKLCQVQKLEAVGCLAGGTLTIVICTGYSETIDVEKAKKMGVRAHVMKPVIQGKLARTVREVLDSPRNPTPHKGYSNEGDGTPDV